MLTDVQLAGSRTVAENAIRRTGLSLSPNELLSASDATALSDEVLRIQARGRTAGQAVRRADALASAFLDLRREVLERHANNTVAALTERAAAIERELADLNERIGRNASGATAGQAPAELSRRVGLNAQAGALRGRIDDTTMGTVLLVNSSGVLGAASVDDRSPAKALAANLAAGTVFGLAVGIGWVLVQEVLSGRIRRREDVMAAMATPVWLSSSRIRHARTLHRRDIRRRLARKRVTMARSRPSGVLALTLHRALPADGDRPCSLVVVSIESDWPAAVAVASLTADLITEGKKVLLLDLSEHSELAKLFGVRPTSMSAVPIPGTDANLWVCSPVEASPAGEAPTDLLQLRSEADVVLVLASANPSVGAVEPSWAAEAVAVVTAGRTTVDGCRWASGAIRAAGLHLATTILVGASRNDDTVAPLRVAHEHELPVPIPHLTS